MTRCIRISGEFNGLAEVYAWCHSVRHLFDKRNQRLYLESRPRKNGSNRYYVWRPVNDWDRIPTLFRNETELVTNSPTMTMLEYVTRTRGEVRDNRIGEFDLSELEAVT